MGTLSSTFNPDLHGALLGFIWGQSVSEGQQLEVTRLLVFVHSHVISGTEVSTLEPTRLIQGNLKQSQTTAGICTPKQRVRCILLPNIAKADFGRLF